MGEVLGLEGTRGVALGAGRENAGSELVKLHSNYVWYQLNTQAQKPHTCNWEEVGNQVILSMCLQQSKQESGILVIFEAQFLFVFLK